MPDLTIRNLPQATIDALSAHAERAGTSREAWLRQELARLVEQPVTPRLYALKALGPDLACAIIRRHNNLPSIADVTGGHWTASQRNVVQEAAELVVRNQPGDRERAIAMLLSVFEQVFEVA
ncbi:MAG: hypothetical protein MI924_28280 [Chloroflexales bacterium]|nr:hypothetical protein [Chloroflexales bacterium]